MKNLLKKILFTLTALVFMLCSISALADEACETETENLPVLEVGRGMNGTLQQDPVTEIRIHAGRSGQVQFTLTLTENCDLSVSFDGKSVNLSRPDDSLPVYTFVRRLSGGEFYTISMTAGRKAGYSMISGPVPEEPAAEAVPEETTDNAPAPAEETETTEPEPETESEPAAEQETPNEYAEPEQQEPIPAEEQPAEEPQPDEPQTEEQTTEEQLTEEQTPAEPETPETDAEPETEDTEPEQPAQQENTPGTTDPADQPEPEETEPQEQTPETETEQQPQPEETEPLPAGEDEDHEDETVESPAVKITKVMVPGESWTGVLKRKTEIVLKLELNTPQMVYMLVEGKNVWSAVQESEEQTDDVQKIMTDPKTDRSLVSWYADEGSCLIKLGLNEKEALMARVKVMLMSENEWKTWDELNNSETEDEPTQEAAESIPGETETAEELPEAESTETENPNPEDGFVLPENAEADFTITWDDENPTIGSVAHFKAIVTGCEGYSYTLQWQRSLDCETWEDVEGATEPEMDVLMTEETCQYYWRVKVYIQPANEE